MPGKKQQHLCEIWGQKPGTTEAAQQNRAVEVSVSELRLQGGGGADSCSCAAATAEH